MELPLPERASRACHGDAHQQQLVRRLLMRDTSPLPAPSDATPPTVGRAPADRPPLPPPPLPAKDRSGRPLTPTSRAAMIAADADRMLDARQRGLLEIRKADTATRDVDPDVSCLACGAARAPQPAVEIRCGTCGRLLDTPSWLGRPGENGSSVHSFHRRPVEEKSLDEPTNGAVIHGPTGPTTTTRGPS